jgi:hypothetical protein
MTPLELLLAETTDEAMPFSARLAERMRHANSKLHEAVLRAAQSSASRSERRAHVRRHGSELDWLRLVRLTGGTGYDVSLIDLSEGGALLQVDAPLRPGLALTLELSGSGMVANIPLEVLRSYIASLRGDVAIYRSAVAFKHLIELPDARDRRIPGVADFVGIDAAIGHLLDRYGAMPTASADENEPCVVLQRADVLQVLDALRARQAAAGRSDQQNRYAAELLNAILPSLHRAAPRDIVLNTLDKRLRALPDRWQLRLAHTRQRLAALIERCAPAGDEQAESTSIDAGLVGAGNHHETLTGQADPDERPEITVGTTTQAESTFQKIVVRYADGQIVKGYTQDFHPSRPQFSLWPSINAAPRDRFIVPLLRLKAVFFVRDFKGNAAYRERKTFTTRMQGRRVEVTFADGEIVIGTTLNYRPDGQGFFLSPADPAANNTRIFVVAGALRRVRFL